MPAQCVNMNTKLLLLQGSHYGSLIQHNHIVTWKSQGLFLFAPKPKMMMCVCFCTFFCIMHLDCLVVVFFFI